MENEQLIGTVENISDYSDTFTMYWTDRRFIMVNTRIQTNVGLGLIPALIGEAATKLTESRKKTENAGLALDEIFAKDKKSFVVDYADIETIELHDPRSRWRSRKLKIKMLIDQEPKEYTLNEQQHEKLCGFLPCIAAFRDKLRIR